jgi:hypothetical protein
MIFIVIPKAICHTHTFDSPVLEKGYMQLKEIDKLS